MDNVARAYIAAEVRAEMARQRKTLRGAAPVLGKSRTRIAYKWRGEIGFLPEELKALAKWMGVPVAQFLPPGYVIETTTFKAPSTRSRVAS